MKHFTCAADESSLTPLAAIKPGHHFTVVRAWFYARGENEMATARILDMEASAGERPQRPDAMPAGAPGSPIFPDVRNTSAEMQALAAERRRGELADRVPVGGLPDGIPHGDRNPGARPHHDKEVTLETLHHAMPR
jgi:hypothetical protein